MIVPGENCVAKNGRCELARFVSVKNIDLKKVFSCSFWWLFPYFSFFHRSLLTAIKIIIIIIRFNPFVGFFFLSLFHFFLAPLGMCENDCFPVLLKVTLCVMSINIPLSVKYINKPKKETIMAVFCWRDPSACA